MAQVLDANEHCLRLVLEHEALRLVARGPERL